MVRWSPSRGRNRNQRDYDYDYDYDCDYTGLGSQGGEPDPKSVRSQA